MIESAFPQIPEHENDALDDEQRLLRFREMHVMTWNETVFSPQWIMERYKAYEDESTILASREEEEPCRDNDIFVIYITLHLRQNCSPG